MCEEEGSVPDVCSSSVMSPSTASGAKPKRDMRAELLAYKQKKAAEAAQQKAMKSQNPQPFRVPRTAASPSRAAVVFSSVNENASCHASSKMAKTPLKGSGPARSALSERCPNTDAPSGATVGGRSVSPPVQRYAPAPRSTRTKTPEPARERKTPDAKRQGGAPAAQASARRAVSPSVVLRPATAPRSPHVTGRPDAASHRAPVESDALPETQPAVEALAAEEVIRAEEHVEQQAELTSPAKVEAPPVEVMDRVEEQVEELPEMTSPVKEEDSKLQQSPEVSALDLSNQDEAPEAALSGEAAVSGSPKPVLGLGVGSASPAPPPRAEAPLPPLPNGPPPVMPPIESVEDEVADAPVDEAVGATVECTTEAALEEVTSAPTALEPEQARSPAPAVQVTAPASPPPTIHSGSLLAAYLPAGSPGFAASPSVAARNGGGLLAAYEERATLPKMPPPSPATPSVALSHARAGVPDLSKVEAAEFAEAAGAALVRLASQEISSSPAAPSPSCQVAGASPRQPLTPRAIAEEEDEPAEVPVSPLSLESQSPDQSCEENEEEVKIET